MGMHTDSNGNTRCETCGSTWKQTRRMQWWPIRLRWKRRSALKFFDWHGWETSRHFDLRCGQSVFGQTFHVGALKICLGTSNSELACQVVGPTR